MTQQHSKLQAALGKVLLELNNCIIKRRTFNAFMSLKSAHGLDYFRVSAYALQNDLYAGAHRAFDSHKDAVSIWYVRNIAPEDFSAAAEEAKIDISELERLAEKLKPIRDRVHFHVDRRELLEPSNAWKDADMTGDEFISLTEKAHEVLRLMYFKLTGENREIPEYYGEDIKDIISAYKGKHRDAPLSI